MTYRTILTFMAALFLQSAAFALPETMTAGRDSSMSDRTHDLNPVVVTGTGTYRRAENSPLDVKVISAKELKDARVSSLQEALSRMTASVTTHTSGMGTFINFNGISDDYLVILVNGRRVSGDDRWERMSMDRVKRIEIYSGAASALYGSDAIAGVINIITDDSKEPMRITAGTKVASKGRQNDDLNIDLNFGRFSSQSSWSRRQADNWQVNRYQAFDEGGTEVLKLTGRPMSAGFRSDNLSQKLEWRANDQWSFYINGSFYDNMSRRPRSAGYFTQKKTTDALTGDISYSYTSKQAYTYDLHHRSWSYGGGARWEPGRNTHLYLDVYSDQFESSYEYWQTADKEAWSETRKRTGYTDGSLKGIFRLTPRNKLSAGMELVLESLESQSDNIDHENGSTFNLFAQEELQLISCLEAVAGVRYTRNRLFGSAFTPTASLFFHTGGLRLRANYAGGYRTPSLSQLYATDQAKTTARYTLFNTALKPEKSSFVNLNAEYGNQWMNASLTLFSNRIRDMINYRTMTQAEIDASPSLTALQDEGWSTIRQRDNIDRAKLQGFSGTLKLLLPSGFSLGGGYTFTDAKAETRSLDAATQQYVSLETDVDKSVRHVGSLLATWDKSWQSRHLNISLDGHMQGRRYSSTYGYAKGYSQWNLGARYTLSYSGLLVEPGLSVENIFDERDNSPWNSNFSTVSPGRSLVASLSIRL